MADMCSLKPVSIRILSKNGMPLPPTGDYERVLKLLKSGKAKVVSKNPAVVQLLYSTPKIELLETRLENKKEGYEKEKEEKELKKRALILKDSFKTKIY